MKIISILLLTMALIACQPKIEYVKVPVPFYVVPELPKTENFSKLDECSQDTPYKQLPVEIWNTFSKETMEIKVRALIESVIILQQCTDNLFDVYKYYQDRAIESKKDLEKLKEIQDGKQ